MQLTTLVSLVLACVWLVGFCNAQLWNREYAMEYFCDGQTYNPANEVCCMNQLHQVDMYSIRHAACCGSEPIDNRTQGCCAFTNHFELISELCCAGTVTTDGGHATHVCCGDNTYMRNNGKMCCMGNVVNGVPWMEQCCGHELIPLMGPEGCCNNMLYDRASAVCCSAFPQYMPGGEYAWQCCGTDVIARDSNDLDCCAGNTTYDPNTQQCCEGSVLDAKGHFRCCNGKMFDSREQSCCKDVLKEGDCPTEAPTQATAPPPPTPRQADTWVAETRLSDPTARSPTATPATTIAAQTSKAGTSTGGAGPGGPPAAPSYRYPDLIEKPGQHVPVLPSQIAQATQGSWVPDPKTVEPSEVSPTHDTTQSSTEAPSTTNPPTRRPPVDTTTTVQGLGPGNFADLPPFWQRWILERIGLRLQKK